MTTPDTSKDDSSGFWNRFGDLLLERFSSPLISTFVISWCVTNYQVLLIVFGKGELDRKLTLLNQYFDGLTITIPWARAWIYGVPLIVTIAYIYIYPWINERVMPKVQRDNYKLQEIKDTVYYKNIVQVRDQRITELMTEKVSMQDDLETLKEGMEVDIKAIRAYESQVKDFEAKIGSMALDPAFKDGAITILMIYTMLLKAHIGKTKLLVHVLSEELNNHSIDLRAFNAVIFNLQKSEIIDVIPGINTGEEYVVFTTSAIKRMEMVGYPTEEDLNKRI